MKTFKDLEFFDDEDMQGIYAYELFDNNFGVSVIKNPYSHGGKQGLYEVAVIYMSPEMKESQIHYNNPVAQGDVIGRLTEDEVSDVMERVYNLNIDEL